MCVFRDIITVVGHRVELTLLKAKSEKKKCKTLFIFGFLEIVTSA